MQHRPSKREIKTFVQTLQASPDDIFPLLCPVRELDWIDGWDADIVYSDSGFAERHCVFETDLSGHGRATWIVTRHDREKHEVEFAIFHHAGVVEKLDVALESNGEGITRLRWTRTYTSLSPLGDTLVEAFSSPMLDARMKWVMTSLEHYLATGEKLMRPVEGEHG